jgi:hypothetical protein
MMSGRRTVSVVLLVAVLAAGCSGPHDGKDGTSAAAPTAPSPVQSTIFSPPSSAQRTAAAAPISAIASAGTTALTGSPPSVAGSASSGLASSLAPPSATSTAAQHAASASDTRSVLGPPTSLAAVAHPSRRPAQLPGGGTTLLPGHLLVALYGQPGTAGLGALGQQDTAASIERVRSIAAPYASLSAAPVLPTFEIIATVADSAAGADGDYSAESSIADLQPTIDAASAAGLYVVLDLQPGRTDFLTQARRYAQLLRRPNVGLALDPEWRLKPDQRHLEQIGSVDASEINQVSSWLADLTAKGGLPQKLLIIHQFQLAMIRHEASLNTAHRELALVVQMDGQGSPNAKDQTWRAITDAAPPGIGFAWKNFFEKDSPTLSAADTMSKKPTPALISYE